MLALVPRWGDAPESPLDAFVSKWQSPALTCLLLNDCQPRLQPVTSLIVDLSPTEVDALWFLQRSLPGWNVEPYGETSARLTPPAYDSTGGGK